MAGAKFGSKPFHIHIIAVVAFLLITIVYLFPVFQGKGLSQSDEELIAGVKKELRASVEEEGIDALWVNSSFSGMPGLFQIIRPGNVLFWLNRVPIYLLKDQVVAIMFVMLVCMYLMLVCFKVHPFLAIAGAIAYSFATLNIIGLEVGHLAKIHAMAYSPAVIGGAYLAFRGKYLVGAMIVALTFGLQLTLSHVQISFYLGLMLVFMGIAELVNAGMNGKLPQFGKAAGALVAAALIALACNTCKLYTMQSYSNESTRGGQILTPANADSRTEKGGLSWGYATGWSYGQLETMNMIIPRFTGGSTSETLPDDANLKTKYGFSQAFTYWGKMDFTEGPTYIGATVFFLFILGLVFVRGPNLWWIVGISLFAMVMSWGSNFEAFYLFMYKNFPLIKKLRTPSMILVILEITMPMLGLLALNEIIKSKLPKEELLKRFYVAAGISVLVVVMFGFLMSGSYSYTHYKDAARFKQVQGLGEQIEKNPTILNNLMDDLKADRKDMLKADAFRSLVFVGLMAGLVFMYIRQRFDAKYFALGVIALIFIDLYLIDIKYLSHDSFVKEEVDHNSYPQATQIDLTIQQDNLQDGDLDYRVINLGRSPFNESVTSLHHNSIGGYSAIKLRRYQDMIENGLSRGDRTGDLDRFFANQQQGEAAFKDLGILNMLNCKYIYSTANNFMRKNPYANGPCWFVQDITWAANPDEEMAQVRQANTKTTAVIEENQRSILGDFTPKYDSSATISLVSKVKRTVSYSANVPGSSPQLAVLSEIYYKGDDDWKVKINGQDAQMFKVNYLLRGVVVPPGESTIEFEFKPKSYFTGRKISIAGSFLMILLLAGSVFQLYRERKNSIDDESLHWEDEWETVSKSTSSTPKTKQVKSSSSSSSRQSSRTKKINPKGPKKKR